MQYLIALLLPATVLASPLVAVRQPRPTAEIIGWSAEPSCGGFTVALDDAKHVAIVSLPNYNVSLPDTGNRERGCSVTMRVRFPAGCTTGFAAGTVSGHVTLPVGGEAKFHSRDYAISPTIGDFTQVSPDGEWRATASTGPIDVDYTLDDRVSYTARTPSGNPEDVNFTLQGRLQLQPSNGASGSLTNDRFVFDIATQIPCCKFKTLLL
jgi:hypothetical protein